MNLKKICYNCVLCGLIVFSILLVLAFIAVIGSYTQEAHRTPGGYFTGKDTIESLGDGRFEIGKVPDHFNLSDNKFRNTVVFDIEKYIINGPIIYIVGYYSDGIAIKDALEQPSLWYLDLKTGEIKMYESRDEIPRYLILNYETAELRTYVDWEDVPLDDKAIFNTPLKECRNWRKQDCWEKSLPKKD